MGGENAATQGAPRWAAGAAPAPGGGRRDGGLPGCHAAGGRGGGRAPQTRAGGVALFFLLSAVTMGAHARARARRPRATPHPNLTLHTTPLALLDRFLVPGWHPTDAWAHQLRHELHHGPARERRGLRVRARLLAWVLFKRDGALHRLRERLLLCGRAPADGRAGGVPGWVVHGRHDLLIGRRMPNLRGRGELATFFSSNGVERDRWPAPPSRPPPSLPAALIFVLVLSSPQTPPTCAVTTCDPGYYASTPDGACQACGIGYTCSGGPQTTPQRTVCPNSLTTLDATASSPAQCIRVCAPGQFAPSPTAACQPCMSPFFCAGGSQADGPVRDPCPQSPYPFVTLTNTAAAQGECVITCPAGLYSPAPQVRERERKRERERGKAPAHAGSCARGGGGWSASERRRARCRLPPRPAPLLRGPGSVMGASRTRAGAAAAPWPGGPVLTQTIKSHTPTSPFHSLSPLPPPLPRAPGPDLRGLRHRLLLHGRPPARPDGVRDRPDNGHGDLHLGQ